MAGSVPGRNEKTGQAEEALRLRAWDAGEEVLIATGYTISIPDVPPSLNQVLVMNRWKRKQLSENWQEEIWYALLACNGATSKLSFAAGNRVRMRVAVTLHNARQYDKDNSYGACKVIFDALKKLRLIWDDRAEFLEASVEQVKSTRKGKKTVIEIGPVL